MTKTGERLIAAAKEAVEAVASGKINNWEFPEYDRLEDATKRFFAILDIQEYSDNSQTYFRPNKMNLETRKIDSIRVHNTAELRDVLKQMKELSGYNLGQEKYVTDPTHGGKVTCHKCNGFIREENLYVFRGEMTIVRFHKHCFNQYDHYYGLDKPID